MNDPNLNSLEWAVDAYCYDYHDGDLKALSELEISQDEVLALSYLRKVHRKVFVEKFTNLSFWSGPHRSGKSYGSVVFGHILDPTFTPRMEHRIITDTTMLYEELSIIREQKIYGAYIQLDEMGNTAGNMDYYTDVGKTISKCLQMVGSLRVQISMCAPLKDFAVSGARKMLHTLYAVQRPSNEYSIITPYNIKPSPISDGIKYPHPRVNLLGMSYKLCSLKMTLPPSWLVSKYESISTGFKGDMLSDFVKSSKESKTLSQPKEKLDIDAAALIVAGNPEHFKSLAAAGRNILSTELVQSHFEAKTPDGVSMRQAKIIKQKAMQIMQETDKAFREGKA